MTADYPIYVAGELVRIRRAASMSPIPTTVDWSAPPGWPRRPTRAGDRGRRRGVRDHLQATPTYERVDLLKAMAAKLKERRDEVARHDRPRGRQADPRGEVETDRGVFTLETAAEEAKRIEGEVIPLDLLPSSKGRFGIVRRFPIGPIAGISPFNFPLNLALHKVAPGDRLGQPDRAQAALSRLR